MLSTKTSEENLDFEERLALAELGDRESQYHCAKHYEMLLKKSYENPDNDSDVENATSNQQYMLEMALWYSRAAAQEHSDAEYELGNLYNDGIIKNEALNGRIDYTRAFTWFKKAAEQGNAKAQYALGSMYARGKSRTTQKGLEEEPDFQMAAEYYKQAAAQGHSLASYSLKIINENGWTHKQKPEAFFVQSTNEATQGTHGSLLTAYKRGKTMPKTPIIFEPKEPSKRRHSAY